MPLLKKITVSNFKSFRDKRSFILSDASYFVGVNNSGKSTVLNAIHFFFDNSVFVDESFVNKTSFLSKKADSNISEITIDFNLEALNTRKLKQDLIKKFGPNISISKLTSITTDTRVITHSYRLNGTAVTSLPEEVARLIKSVKVTYLHPQEGQDLIIKAQEKLRQRLLANWGRGSNITQSIKVLQSSWDDLRDKSKTYLSGTLTDSLQKMWPNSEVTINLPKDIKDIIAVSDINFSGYKNAPEIGLTAQGTGAQSTILYLTHFLLDSDRSLHRGEYHPLWLLEEPESFLHVDLLSNLAKQLNSEKWLSNIQMLISTHSPVLLAGSRIAKQKVVWTALTEKATTHNKLTTEYLDDEVKEIGRLMGDSNFFAYFLAAQGEPLIFVEDNKGVTVRKYVDGGIKVSKGLKGTSEVANFLETYISAPHAISGKIYFILDSDKGKAEFGRFYDERTIDKTKSGFERFRVKTTENVFLVFLPVNSSSEDLFAEFRNHLEECISKIWTPSWKLQDTCPTELSGLASLCRRSKVASRDDAISLIKNHDDVKSLFWQKVDRFKYKISVTSSRALKALIS